LEWLTTVLGVHYFGAVELNILFVGAVSSNILVYSVIKLVATMLIGCLFYKGYAMVEVLGINSNFGKFFLRSGYFTSFTVLMLVVANNLVSIVTIHKDKT
ncbi:MAG: hypothetical protein QXL10_05685, partial [Candidatus Bathyarchaeia archaeon]